MTDAEFLTTTEVAELVGAGTTSVKRWADAGEIECVKTPGGHRRFPRAAVEAFLAAESGNSAPETQMATSTIEHVNEIASAQSPEAWAENVLDLILSEADVNTVFEVLAAKRDELETWAQACDAIGLVLREIGCRWEVGAISVLEEHIASGLLGRALFRCSDAIDVARDAPTAFLMTAANDDHTLGLWLAELVFRECGWTVRWAGRRTPVELAARFVSAGRCDIVAVSASGYSTDGYALQRQAARLGQACRESGAKLILGGAGHWPDLPRFGTRMHSFVELETFLADLETPTPRERAR